MLWVRRLRPVLLGLVVAYAVFLGGMFAVMCQPPERFGVVMRHFPMPAMMIVPFKPMWYIARGGSLHLGDIAPDFTLRTADKTSEVRLSAFRGRQPVVLIFGSYT